MTDPIEAEAGGKVDFVSVLYIVLGVPGIFMFLVVVFGAVKLWNIPA
jgi:hypothetical protein